MTIREYGAVCTATLGSIFGFELIWSLTTIDAIEAAFLALLIGIACAIVYAFLTEPRPVKESKPEYEFATDSTGLNVLIRRKAS